MFHNLTKLMKILMKKKVNATGFIFFNSSMGSIKSLSKYKKLCSIKNYPEILNIKQLLKKKKDNSQKLPLHLLKFRRNRKLKHQENFLKIFSFKIC